MYRNILRGDIVWPSKEKHKFEFSNEARDLISKLLISDKSKRFGARNDAD